ncbi:MAG TPA: hypothetical protein VFH50_11605 [Acidimicrobiales bacterium]|nr:hypothetical protein [Acidimicrobiales bacterium]
MQSAPGYVFSGIVRVGTDQVRITGRFQAPDRLDETIQVPGHSSVNAVLVGTTTFVRDPVAGTWRRSTGTGSGADPRTAFSVLLQASAISRSGSTYHFSVPAQAAARLASGTVATGPAAGSAELSAGTITRLMIDLPGQGRTVSISLDYSSIGTAPPVTAPPGA